MRKDFKIEDLRNLKDTNSYSSWLSRSQVRKEITKLQDKLIDAAGSGYKKAILSEFNSGYHSQTKIIIDGIVTVLDLQNITFIVNYLETSGFTLKEKKHTYKGLREFELEW